MAIATEDALSTQGTAQEIVSPSKKSNRSSSSSPKPKPEVYFPGSDGFWLPQRFNSGSNLLRFRGPWSRLTKALRDADRKLPHQPAVYDFYETRLVQLIVAAIILINFIFEAVQAQIAIDVDAGKYADTQHVLDVFEWMFTIFFTVEVVVNIYGECPDGQRSFRSRFCNVWHLPSTSSAAVTLNARRES